jgi:hypothetical protein
VSLGLVGHLKNSLSIAARGARQQEPFPKTAICCHLGAQNRYFRFNRSIPFLPLEGKPASLGPGLRTVSGAERSLGEKLSPSAVCAMTGESTAKDGCIRECDIGRQLINLGRISNDACEQATNEATPTAKT